MGSGGNGVERGKASSFSDERAQPNRHSYNPLPSFLSPNPKSSQHGTYGRGAAQAARGTLLVWEAAALVLTLGRGAMLTRPLALPPSSQQMMGAEAMGITTTQLSITDEKVCKNFLCGTCPHVVFTNTVSPEQSSPPPSAPSFLP